MSHVASVGTEPLSFYFVNGFINFNGAFGLALMALPVAVSSAFIYHKLQGKQISDLM